MKFIQIIPKYAEGSYNRGRDKDGKVLTHPAYAAVYATESIAVKDREAVKAAIESIHGKFNPDIVIEENQVTTINREPSRVHAAVHSVDVKLDGGEKELEDYTVGELKDLAAGLKIDVPDKIKKADLIELIRAQQAE